MPLCLAQTTKGKPCRMYASRSAYCCRHMEPKTYWKMIGKNNGHFPYHLGINSLAETKETFDPHPRCGPGGLYFTDAKHILNFLSYGTTICKIRIPNRARVVKVDTKWKANKIEILSMRPLAEEDSIDVHADNEAALCEYARNGEFPTVKYLVEECKADVNAQNGAALSASAANGYKGMVKYLIKQGADVQTTINELVAQGHLSLAEYLESLR